MILWIIKHKTIFLKLAPFLLGLVLLFGVVAYYELKLLDLRAENLTLAKDKLSLEEKNLEQVQRNNELTMAVDQQNTRLGEIKTTCRRQMNVAVVNAMRAQNQAARVKPPPELTPEHVSQWLRDLFGPAAAEGL